MNRFAYRTTGLLIKTISELSKAHINLHGTENIPEGANIFVVNHFTRLETFLMPYQIFKLTGLPVWSLAAYSLFRGSFGAYLEKIGAVSTKNPARDRLIVKTLLTGEANWIIFPEGRMVKNKKIVEKGRFMISYAGGKHPPHTGAAILAMRTEFYRQRLQYLAQADPAEAEYLQAQFEIEELESVLNHSTHIVPVNLTYFPVRAKENLLSNLATHMVEGIPERVLEEIMTEGTMLFSGVDIDIRFGAPIRVGRRLDHPVIQSDVKSTERIEFDDPLPSRLRMRKEALGIMESYMSAIYSLTTINHDHLLATILRLSPYKSFEERDLRCKLFMAAEAVRQLKSVHLHHRLGEDQLHLLTDDREKRVRDFLTVAVEKGILRDTGTQLIKDRSKFTSPIDFHRVRIDNPLDVMANAVEPLKDLQRILRKIAWTPHFWIRRKTAGHLIRRAHREFEQDYRRYYVEARSKPKKIGEPFLIRGASRDIGVVLIHGYMAAPEEIKSLAMYLGRKGLWVYAPRIKGHGTAPEDLAQVTHRQWEHSAEIGYAIMRCLCRRVIVGGFSNGGALALELATRIEDAAAVFAISPPLRLKDLSSRLVPAVDVWNRFMKRFNMEDARMEFIDNKPENPHINYLRNPIAGVRQLERLMDAIGPRLPALMAPALIVQGQGDPIVNPKGSVRLFQRLGSRDKAYVLFSLERHGIVNGEGSERVFRVVWDFVERVSKRPGESQIRPAVQADAGAEKNDAAAGPQNRSEPI